MIFCNKQEGNKTSVPGSMIEYLEKEKRGNKGKRCTYSKSYWGERKSGLGVTGKWLLRRKEHSLNKQLIFNIDKLLLGFRHYTRVIVDLTCLIPIRKQKQKPGEAYDYHLQLIDQEIETCRGKISCYGHETSEWGQE